MFYLYIYFFSSSSIVYYENNKWYKFVEKILLFTSFTAIYTSTLRIHIHSIIHICTHTYRHTNNLVKSNVLILYILRFSATSCTTELAFLGAVEEGRPEVLDVEVANYLKSQPGIEVREGVLGTLPRVRARNKSAEGEVVMLLDLLL